MSDVTADGALLETPASPVSGTSAANLAAMLCGRLCHDLISPASAIVSGLDLLDDPTAADMRDDAMNLIEASARKLVAHLAFTRIAFGASSAAETFDPRELHRLTEGVFQHIKPSLDWAVEAPGLNKPAARALMNLAQIGGAALPTGGVARVTASVMGREMVMAVEATGPKVRLRTEVLSGLKGEALVEGLSGPWVQAFYLHTLLAEAGGKIETQIGVDHATFRATCPA